MHNKRFTQWMKKNGMMTLLLFMIPLIFTCPMTAEDLPIKSPVSKGYKPLSTFSVDCLLTVDTIQSCIKSGSRGLVLDLGSVRKLLDGTQIKPTDRFVGTIYMGPYPFETEENAYSYKRFRVEQRIMRNRAILPVSYFLGGYRNSEGWKSGGTIVVRLQLYLETRNGVLNVGLYDTFIGFKRTVASPGKLLYSRRTAIMDGPTVNLITSDDTSYMVVAYQTDQKEITSVILNDGRKFSDSKPATKHEIKITGLEANREYQYKVKLTESETRSYSFKTAPKKGDGEIIFAYCGDSRAGVGGGTANLMGVNHNIMERLANLAYQKNAEFFIFGGDLVNGYTTSPDDFRTQLTAWKQATAGFRAHRPIYSCIGNHESLLRAFTDKPNSVLVMDRWPYETESTEAVFADQLVNPVNGPERSDPRRPTYKENVYSFQYGPVLFISFNNNYWVTRNLARREGSWRTGGCPEGYILPDQMAWIKKELDRGEADESVKYIILYAQEPVFPNGGHTADAMWYKGNNSPRSFTYDKKLEKLVPEKLGILEVRNQLVTMIGNNKKVAAVLGSDEHSYHKVLIDKNVPVGVPKLDAKEGSVRVCNKGGTCSPIAELAYPTWYMVCGGGGAPYYSKEKTPWNQYWESNPESALKHTSKRGFFHYSSQENMFLFKAGKNGISMTVINPYGETIDTIEDLLSVKGNN